MSINRKDFSWFDLNPELTYFDSAATSLKPKYVIESVVKYLERETYNTHNTDSKETYKTKIVYNETKKLLGNYFGANPDNIAFTSGATLSINIISLGLEHIFKNGGEILLNTLEHSSNILPFIELTKNTEAKIRYIYSKSIFLTEDEILTSITLDTKIISFCNSSNLIGKKIDAEKISKKIKKMFPNILIIVDATQYSATKKMNIADSMIDFLVCSAHKMMGPTGIGMLYVSNLALKIIRPRIVGGGMNLYVNKFDYEPLLGIQKLESGTLNIEGIYGWNAALKYYETFDMDSENKKINELKDYIENELNKIDEFIIHNPKVKSTLIIFSRKNVNGQDFTHYLGLNGIIARAGLSCAKLIYNNINVKDVVRISMHFYTTKEDVEKLISVIKNYKKGDELIGLI